MAHVLALLLGLTGCAASDPWHFGDVDLTDTLGPTPLQDVGRTPPHLAIEPPPEAAAPEAIEPEGPLHLSLEEAVFMALRHNRALSVEQLTPVIAGTFEEIERAVYDPTLVAGTVLRRDEAQQVSRATGTTFSVQGQDTSESVGLSQRLPTGTQIDVDLSHSRSYSNRTPDQHGVRGGLTLTQALLQGASLQANLASIRQARLNTLASEYELRGFAQALVAQVEDTYWQYVLARREIEIFDQSLELAQEQQANTEQRVAVGTHPETELAAARAEVALRRQERIDARNNLAQLRLQLLRLVNPPSRDGWDRTLIATTDPDLPAPDVPIEDVEEHAALALRLRPELHEARLRLEQDRLEVVQTRNGLLPRLDLFVTLGKSGFADAFGQAVRDMDGPSYDFAVGLDFAYPLGNRAAQARHTQSLATRLQTARSLENLAQLVTLDVRSAYLEVQRAAEQIEASAVTRELQEEVLRAETAKFRVGQSTAVLVAQAQRDLVTSRIAEVEATISYRRALVDLYRLEGSLLLRRGITAPGKVAD